MTRRSPERLALVGFMGAGKTAVGRGVSDRLGWTLVDTDRDIEAATGCSVARLFDEEGEAAFRVREGAAVRAALRRSRIVLCPGGGLVSDEDVYARLLDTTWTVHLSVPFDVSMQRARAEGDSRPLLRDAATARRLFHARASAYARAHVTVATVDRTPAEVVEAVLAWWRERGVS